MKKPLLRAKKKQKRLQWARNHKDWTKEKWNEVRWSDESKFEIFGSKRRVFVRRFKGERASRQCLVPFLEHGGGSVMVWGCFARNQMGSLKK